MCTHTHPGKRDGSSRGTSRTNWFPIKRSNQFSKLDEDRSSCSTARKWDGRSVHPRFLRFCPQAAGSIFHLRRFLQCPPSSFSRLHSVPAAFSLSRPASLSLLLFFLASSRRFVRDAHFLRPGSYFSSRDENPCKF